MAHHQQNPREQKYTAAEVQGWRKLMRENKWQYDKLAEHLGLTVNIVKKMFEKEAYGELRR